MTSGRRSLWNLVTQARRARRAGVLLAVLAVLSQTGLLLLHRPGDGVPTRHHEHVAFHDVAHGDVPAASPADRPDDPGRSVHCPICLALHLIGGFVPPETIVLAGTSWTAIRLEHREPPRAVAPRFASDLRSRAPPVRV
jgi:hypothetical protein